MVEGLAFTCRSDCPEGDICGKYPAKSKRLLMRWLLACLLTSLALCGEVRAFAVGPNTYTIEKGPWIVFGDISANGGKIVYDHLIFNPSLYSSRIGGEGSSAERRIEPYEASPPSWGTTYQTEEARLSVP